MRDLWWDPEQQRQPKARADNDNEGVSVFACFLFGAAILLLLVVVMPRNRSHALSNDREVFLSSKLFYIFLAGQHDDIDIACHQYFVRLLKKRQM